MPDNLINFKTVYKTQNKMKMNLREIIMAAMAASAAMLGAVCAQAQPNTELRPDKTVFLYSDDAKGVSDTVTGRETTCAGYSITEKNGLSGQEELQKSGNLGNISDDARFDLYFPEKPNGQMVVVCPGGGYAYVSTYNEGVYVAEWMVEHGITVAVVKYRMPNGHWEVPLTDVQNTFRYCREHAEEWGVTQIGVMGFSAGGHLAATTSTMYADAETRPDFSVLIYPVITMDPEYTHKGTRNNLIGTDKVWEKREGMSWEEWNRAQGKHEMLVHRYSLENQVTADTPATFIALSSDDNGVPPENSIRYYRSLIKNGVSAEMHIYPSGGHGWGFTTLRYSDKDRMDYARSEFEASLERWLDSISDKR